MLYATDTMGQKATVDEDLNVMGEEPMATFIRGQLLGADLYSMHIGTKLEAVSALLLEIGITSELDEGDVSTSELPEGAVF